MSHSVVQKISLKVILCLFIGKFKCSNFLESPVYYLLVAGWNEYHRKWSPRRKLDSKFSSTLESSPEYVCLNSNLYLKLFCIFFLLPHKGNSKFFFFFWEFSGWRYFEFWSYIILRYKITVCAVNSCLIVNILQGHSSMIY